MAATYTNTSSQTSTCTDARVRHVMNKVHDDLVMLEAREFVSPSTVLRWVEETREVLAMEAATRFQVKLTTPLGVQSAIEYRVSADGSVSEDRESGGVNFYSLPRGTKASIVIELVPSGPKRERALEYLKKRGWGFNGQLLAAPGTQDRAYSSGGYGLNRNLIGLSS